MDNGVDIDSRDLNRFIFSSALLSVPAPWLCPAEGDSSLMRLAGDGCGARPPPPPEPCGDLLLSTLSDRRASPAEAACFDPL